MRIDASPMVQELIVVLHGGHGVELTLLEYLYRVGLHLLAFGAVVLVGLRAASVVEAVRSALSRGPE